MTARQPILHMLGATRRLPIRAQSRNKGGRVQFKMEVLMRFVLAGCVVMLCGVSFDTAKADPYPWCAEYTGGGLGGSSNCYFMTLQQCQATVSGVGGYCTQNSYYTGPAVKSQQQQQQQSPWNQQQSRPRFF
jgi:Protein of unknown function (DUF3551)